MPRHRVEAERKTCEPESSSRDPAATQVGNDDAPTRDAIELANDACEVFVGEMVKKLGTDDDVDAMVAKGKRARVAAHREIKDSGCRAQQIRRLVEPDRPDARASSPPYPRNRGRNVGESRSDVEERERRISGEQVVDRRKGSPPATEKDVRPSDVTDGSDPRRRVHAGVIEDFVASSPLRSTKEPSLRVRQRQRSSCEYPPR